MYKPFEPYQPEEARLDPGLLVGKVIAGFEQVTGISRRLLPASYLQTLENYLKEAKGNLRVSPLRAALSGGLGDIIPAIDGLPASSRSKLERSLLFLDMLECMAEQVMQARLKDAKPDLQADANAVIDKSGTSRVPKLWQNVYDLDKQEPSVQKKQPSRKKAKQSGRKAGQTV